MAGGEGEWPEAAAEAPEADQAEPLLNADGSRMFQVHLTNFEGPFDLLLGLISKHKLDITEVALSVITDEFIAHIKDQDWDLSQASEFLVVAATLLDLKAARLLPTGSVDDSEDLELLEARDLLFARLLQYRAFKEVARSFGERLASESRRWPRSVPLETQFAALLPELIWSIGPDELAVLAARAMAPKALPAGVNLDHLHAPPVSVREQAAVIVDRLRQSHALSFRTLVSDAEGTLVVVARFLALLELFRERVIAFDQVTPLGELTVRWTGSEDGDVAVDDDYDDFEEASDDVTSDDDSDTQDPSEGGPA